MESSNLQILTEQCFVSDLILFRNRAMQPTSIFLRTQLNSTVWILMTSFIQAISVAPLQLHYYSEALLTQNGYCVRVSRCQSLKPKRHRQLRVKDLPKVPTWQCNLMR